MAALDTLVKAIDMKERRFICVKIHSFVQLILDKWMLLFR